MSESTAIGTTVTANTGSKMTYEEFHTERYKLSRLPESEEKTKKLEAFLVSAPLAYLNRFNQEQEAWEKELLSWRDYQVIGETKEARRAKALLTGHELDESDERFVAVLLPEAAANEAEVWHFRSPDYTWATLSGREGFMISKGNKVLKTSLTKMN
jgi:hypothetical protein